MRGGQTLGAVVSPQSLPIVPLPPPRLSLQRFGGQMLGLWFLATSLGNLDAGQFRAESGGDMPTIFLTMALAALAMTVVLIVLAKPISRLVEPPRSLSE